MLRNPERFDRIIQCSFDRETQSMIFSGNKATDQNKFDNCEDYEHHLNETIAGTYSIRLILEILHVENFNKY